MIFVLSLFAALSVQGAGAFTPASSSSGPASGLTPQRSAVDPFPGSKSIVLDLLRNIPRNAATSRKLTSDILSAVRTLEQECPTPDADVLGKLAGK
jgi:hypothetical protein